MLDNALKGKETANFEFPLYTKQSERIEILLNAATRRDANNEIVGVVGVGQDMCALPPPTSPLRPTTPLPRALGLSRGGPLD